MAQTIPGALKVQAARHNMTVEEYSRLRENGLKCCSKCAKWLPVDQYFTRSDGRRLKQKPACKSCESIRRKAYYYADPERWRAAAMDPKHREKKLAQRRQHRRNLKSKVLEAYGGCCQCCGEAEPYFLSLDHINNDGAIHRKNTGGPRNFYTWVVKNGYPTDLRLLCFNCNHGRFLAGGICPHESAKAA